jgi:hypothetical protein
VGGWCKVWGRNRNRKEKYIEEETEREKRFAWKRIEGENADRK